jgi:hypothetical protein
MECYSNFLLPNSESASKIYAVFLGISALAEISFALWLVVKGVTIEQGNQSNLDVA